MVNLSGGDGTEYSVRTAENSSDSTISYVGKSKASSATSSAVWQIKRISESGNDLTIDWADGDTTFSKIWNNRESLSYS